MREITLLVSLVLLLIAGCTQPSAPAPGDTQPVSGPQPASPAGPRPQGSTPAGDSLVVESMSPPSGAQLTAGQTVHVTTLVSYTLSSEREAEVLLLYEDERSSFPIFARKSVGKGSGRVTLEGQFRVSAMGNVRIKVFLARVEGQRMPVINLDAAVYGLGGAVAAAPRTPLGTRSAAAPTPEPTFKPQPLPPGIVDPAASAAAPSVLARVITPPAPAAPPTAGPPRGPQVAVARRESYGWAKQHEIDFQATAVGTSNVSVITIINTGDELARVESITASLPDFAASPSTFAIQPQSSQEVSVTFTPSQIQQGSGNEERKLATLTVSSNDPSAPRATVKLSGVAANPLAIVSTDYHDFGPVAIGQSATMTFAVSNTAIVPLSITGIVPTASDLEAYPASFTVAPKSSRDIVVTFRPSRAGGRWEMLRINTNDPRNPTRSVRLAANYRKLYLLPDSTLGDSPYEGDGQTIGIPYNQSAEWKHRLPSNLGPDYLVSLRAGALQPASGVFSVELILDVSGSQTVLASTRLSVAGARLTSPLPGRAPVWSTDPSQETVSLNGVALTPQAGGSLILRVTNLKQGLGIIELKTDKPSYVAISSN